MTATRNFLHQSALTFIAAGLSTCPPPDVQGLCEGERERIVQAVSSDISSQLADAFRSNSPADRHVVLSNANQEYAASVNGYSSIFYGAAFEGRVIACLKKMSDPDFDGLIDHRLEYLDEWQNLKCADYGTTKYPKSPNFSIPPVCK